MCVCVCLGLGVGVYVDGWVSWLIFYFCKNRLGSLKRGLFSLQFWKLSPGHTHLGTSQHSRQHPSGRARERTRSHGGTGSRWDAGSV